MIVQRIIFPLIFCICITLPLAAQNNYPVKCTTIYNSYNHKEKIYRRDTVVQQWFYDSENRLLLDSLKSSAEWLMTMYPSERYIHHSDTVIVKRINQQDALLALNPNGFPTHISTNYFGDKENFMALYNTDGTLRHILIAKHNGENETINNIAYKHGNVVSYRSTYKVHKDSAAFVEKYKCTYYSNKKYVPYNPTFQMWALKNWEDAGRPNIQAFSNSLLKSVRHVGGAYYTKLAYGLDDKHRVASITKTHRQKYIPAYKKYFYIEYNK